MKREVEFRGQTVKDKRWVYGGYAVRDENQPIGKPKLHHFIIDVNRGDWGMIDFVEFEVIPNTVGEFTGLLDKKGKRIYEGDIISNPYNDDKKVVEYGLHYDDKSTSESKSIGFKTSERCGLGLDINGEMVLEVIGNVFENPELL